MSLHNQCKIFAAATIIAGALCAAEPAAQSSQAARPPGPTVTIKNAKSKRCIGVDRASTANGAHIKQFNCDENAPNQQWTKNQLTPGDRFFTLRNKKSRKCMGVDQASTRPGANLRQFECDDKGNQRWKLHDGGIQNFDELCIGVDGGSVENGAQLKQFPCDGKPNQQWQVD